MDPATIVQLVAAGVQFGQAAVHIGKRIGHCAGLFDEIPREIQDLKDRGEKLELLNCNVELVTQGLENGQFDKSHQKSLETALEGIRRRVAELRQRIDRALPNESTNVLNVVLDSVKAYMADPETRRQWDGVLQYMVLVQQLQTTFIYHGVAKGQNFGNTQFVQHASPKRVEFKKYTVQNYVDRPGIASQLRDALESPQTNSRPVVVLRGMGGQGKTQLAISYCREAERRNQYHAIFWLDATTRTTITAAVERVADRLKRPEQRLHDSASKIEIFRRVLSEWDEPWLLVFDNYDDPLEYSLDDNYFPFDIGKKSRILVTSRSSELSRYGTILTMPAMAESEAVQLLRSQNPSSSFDGDEKAIEIARRLGHLPLALDQAGSFISRNPNMDFAKFVADYESMRKEVWDHVPPGWDYKGVVATSENHGISLSAKTVLVTWTLSLQQLLDNSENGYWKASFLNVAAYFDPADISEDIFRDFHESDTDPELRPEWMGLFTDGSLVWRSDKFASVLDELAQMSLVSSVTPTIRLNDNPLHFSLHPLVREWIRLRLDDDSQKESIRTAARTLAVFIMRHTLRHPTGYYLVFQLDSQRRRAALNHTFAWYSEFEEHRASLRPTNLSPISDEAIAFAEQVLSEFLGNSGRTENQLQIRKWFLDPSNDRFLSQRAKWEIEQENISALVLNLQASEAWTKALGWMQRWSPIWESLGEIECLFRTKLLVLTTGSRYGDDEAKKEVVCMARDWLRQYKDELAIHHRFHHNFRLELAAILHELDNQTKAQKQESNGLFRSLYLESQQMGSSSYRARAWTLRDWYYILEWSMFAAGNEANASQLLEEGISCMEKMHGPDHNFVWACRLRKAEFLFWAKNNVDESLRLCQLLLAEILPSCQMDGSHVRIYELTGKILAEKKDWDQACAMFQMATYYGKGTEWETREQPRLGLAQCKREMGQTAEAATHLRCVFETRGSLPSTHFFDSLQRLALETPEYVGDEGWSMNLWAAQLALVVHKKIVELEGDASYAGTEEGEADITVCGYFRFKAEIQLAFIHAGMENIVNADTVYSSAVASFSRTTTTEAVTISFIKHAYSFLQIRNLTKFDKKKIMAFREWATFEISRRMMESCRSRTFRDDLMAMTNDLLAGIKEPETRWQGRDISDEVKVPLLPAKGGRADWRMHMKGPPKRSIQDGFKQATATLLCTKPLFGNYGTTALLDSLAKRHTTGTPGQDE